MSSLYDVRVSMHEGSTSSSSKLASEFLAEREEQEAASTEQADHIDFSAGNPRVEHLTGTVHLYRQVPSRADAESHRPDALPVGQPSFPLHHCCMSPALKPASKEGRSERLCVLALPLGMCVADFCAFVGGYLPSVREMRLVRRSDESSVCLVLLRFKDRPTADLFYIDFNNRAFSSLEPHVCCRLVYVRDVALTTAGIASSAHLPPPAGQTELPTCPVCLERLDEHVSGVVTTVCNHRFHNECLQRWGDTKCPVCRYCAQSSNDQSKCNSCSSTQDLWICLICGHIGCGRYHSKHAVAHWRETQHCYALDLETQRVWDYASDGYVHRLVQSKSDGKLVEVPSPGPSSGEAELAPAENELVQAAVQSKRDEMDRQIDQLLWSQSESMRNFWEDQLAEQAEQAQFQVKALQAKAEKLQLAAEQALAEKREAEQQRKASERAAHNTKQALDAKVAELTAKRDRLQVERDFLKTTSSNLLNNQKDWKDMLSAEKCRVIEQDAEIASLKEQVRDLMVFLDVQQQVQQQGGGELEGGTVLPVPEQPQPARRRGRGRGR